MLKHIKHVLFITTDCQKNPPDGPKTLITKSRPIDWFDYLANHTCHFASV